MESPRLEPCDSGSEVKRHGVCVCARLSEAASPFTALGAGVRCVCRHVRTPAHAKTALKAQCPAGVVAGLGVPAMCLC